MHQKRYCRCPHRGSIGTGFGAYREEGRGKRMVNPDGRRTVAIAEAVLWALLRIATRAE